MFKKWVGRTVTIVHSNPKKSLTGVLTEYSGESIVLKFVADSEGKSISGQQAFCLRNPVYEKFMCTVE